MALAAGCLSCHFSRTTLPCNIGLVACPPKWNKSQLSAVFQRASEVLCASSNHTPLWLGFHDKVTSFLPLAIALCPGGASCCKEGVVTGYLGTFPRNDKGATPQTATYTLLITRCQLGCLDHTFSMHLRARQSAFLDLDELICNTLLNLVGQHSRCLRVSASHLQVVLELGLSACVKVCVPQDAAITIPEKPVCQACCETQQLSHLRSLTVSALWKVLPPLHIHCCAAAAAHLTRAV